MVKEFANFIVLERAIQVILDVNRHWLPQQQEQSVTASHGTADSKPLIANLVESPGTLATTVPSASTWSRTGEPGLRLGVESSEQIHRGVVKELIDLTVPVFFK